MTAKPKGDAASKQDGPLKVPFEFDDAIRCTMKVKPPAEGWSKYEAKLRKTKTRSTQRKNKTD